MDEVPNAGAAAFLPGELDLSALREAARRCEGCDLFRNATQTVFGEGAEDAGPGRRLPGLPGRSQGRGRRSTSGT
jgi:hypothetical protein